MKVCKFAELVRTAGLTPSRPLLGAPALGIRLLCPCCAGRGSVPLPLDGAALLRAIVRDFGLDNFTVAQLTKHADLIDGPLRPLLADYNGRQVGKAPSAIEGKAIDGMRLQNEALERGLITIRHTQGCKMRSGGDYGLIRSSTRRNGPSSEDHKRVFFQGCFRE